MKRKAILKKIVEFGYCLRWCATSSYELHTHFPVILLELNWKMTWKAKEADKQRHQPEKRREEPSFYGWCCCCNRTRGSWTRPDLPKVISINTLSFPFSSSLPSLLCVAWLSGCFWKEKKVQQEMNVKYVA